MLSSTTNSAFSGYCPTSISTIPSATSQVLIVGGNLFNDTSKFEQNLDFLMLKYIYIKRVFPVFFKFKEIHYYMIQILQLHLELLFNWVSIYAAHIIKHICEHI
jgi:hypothetical protein